MSCLSFLHNFLPRTLFPVTGHYSTHLKIVTSRSNRRPYSEFSYRKWSPAAFKEKASRKLHTGFPLLSDKSLPSTHVKPVGEKGKQATISKINAKPFAVFFVNRHSLVVKQASKDIFYTSVVVAGIGITGNSKLCARRKRIQINILNISGTLGYLIFRYECI